MEKKELLLVPWIGFEIQVIRSSNRLFIGLKGKVVDETKNTLVVETGGVRRRIPKGVCVFRVFSGKKTFDVEGKKIMFKPEEKAKHI
ncbi:ribonuclease P protein subunit [Candidatus Micrarchaeota archaeon]|nr:ribonuclease P protein subunit [Candidatus Micrarchaeota archaeon]